MVRLREGGDAAHLDSALVVFYGSRKPTDLLHYLESVQSHARKQLGKAFTPRDPYRIHSTIIGLGAVSRTLIWPKEQGADASTQHSVAEFLQAFTSETASDPLTIKYGGYARQGYALESRGASPYDRSMVISNGQLVVVGWPVDGRGRPRERLDTLRRRASTYGIAHRYPLSDKHTDPDSHMVIGDVFGDKSSPKIVNALHNLRQTMSKSKCKATITATDASVVVYTDPSLPPETTVNLDIDTALVRLRATSADEFLPQKGAPEAYKDTT